jgi:hypothetical protein
MRKMLDSFRGKVLRTSPIEQITRDGRGWRLHGADQPLGRFDAVVLACHADQAAAMLSDQLHPAEALLNCFRYQPNRAVLHNDTALMPKRRSVWSSWNYLSESHGEDTQLSVTYWMNRLQGIEDEREWLVTLNPLREPDPAKVHAEMDYEHPVFDRAALRAQSMLPRVQGDSNLWLCGSYHGYGFHEDALSSAVRVAEDLGVTAPWSLMPSPAASNSREPAAVC